MNQARSLLIAASLGFALVLNTTFALAQLEESAWADKGEYGDDSIVSESVNAACHGDLSQSDALTVCIDAIVLEKIFRKNPKDEPDSAAAGAVITVVKGTDILIKRGYGCADASTGKRMDEGVESALIRVGSISKLITATAVMQLVERGQLNLDVDINRYLDAGSPKIPATFAQPVTLRNLLTHTAGFEQNQIGSIKTRVNQLVSLGQHLRSHQSARVRPPAAVDPQTGMINVGRDALYSNWGMALAGHIVAIQSRQPFDHYVEANIFGPLVMDDSTFREPGQQPMPAGWSKKWEQQLTKGHKYTKHKTLALPAQSMPSPVDCPPHQFGTFEPKGFEYLNDVAPAAGLTTTITDMAHFMSMQLQDGQFGGKHILTEKSVEQMQGRRLNPYPSSTDFNAGGLAFQEYNWSGRRVIAHSGQTAWFVSTLSLVPEDHLGIFIAVNGPVPGAGLRNAVQAFLTQYLKLKLRPPEPPHDPGSAARYAGTYFSNSHSYTTNEKFFMFTNPRAEITIEYQPASQTLHITNLYNATSDWQQVKPGLFRRLRITDKTQTQQQELIYFDDKGKTMQVLGPMPFNPAYKLETYETPAFHRALLGLNALLFVAGLAWPMLLFGGAAANGPNVARRLARGLSACNLLALTILIWAFSQFAPVLLLWGYTASVKFASALLLLSVVLTLAVCACMVLCWIRNWWTRQERIRYTAFALVALTFLWSMNHWNLIGFKLS